MVKKLKQEQIQTFNYLNFQMTVDDSDNTTVYKMKISLKISPF